MGALYSLAEEVILWLGPASFDSDLAMDTVRAVSEKKALVSQENFQRFSIDEEMVEKAGLAKTSEETRRAHGSLFNREWFQRLWVFQEIVLARKGQVLCGAKAVTWESFADATIAIARLQFHQFSIIFPDVIRDLRAVDGVLDMTRAAHFKRWMDRILDRVYGILAIAALDWREKIKVDYSQRGPHAFCKTYIECGKACIEEDASLALLYMLSGTTKNPRLPSWCPDFNAAQSRKFYLNAKWKAGIKTAPAEEGEPAAWFEPGCDDLYAPGCSVDIVRQVASSTFCWSSMERDGELPSIEDSVNNLAWQREYRPATRGQKFFNTVGGCIGVGPPETQTGDHVYILYGAGPLYLLRFTDEASRVLGNVYIHELMNLDETPEEAKGENEIVVIN
ncbi:hypothetical protein GJ744_001638 [Endocarpon pusillum]|uniref:Heterokaryon incompatibility domain-containing protein n=1 Tax=Endocarpon pusillum TaxID=364733 RepID=A0A8H7A913_9EURO|nr:hypothetical protein GJ744_001638 [Endocarpon pusillum]